METVQVLLSNIDRLHTTEMGIDRIRKNIGLDAAVDVVDYCREKIMDKRCMIYQ